MCRAVEASDGVGMVGDSGQLEGLALRIHTMVGASQWVEAFDWHSCSAEAWAGCWC